MEHKASTILMVGLRPTRDAPETPGEEGMLVMDETLRLLLEEGGPIIRYLAAAEFLPVEARSDNHLPERDLLESQEVRTWLDNLSSAATPRIRPNTIHGGADTCYENAMGKLVQYGLHAGMPEFDERTAPFRQWLSEFPGNEKYVFGSFYAAVVASFLAMAGYRDDAVIRVLQERLSITHRFCSQERYDIYVSKDGFRSVPKTWADVPLVDPALYPGENWCLPWIYDFSGYVALMDSLPDDTLISGMVDTVIGYVFRPEYQSLRDGYGIVTDGKGRFWGMGWSVHLPEFSGAPLEKATSGLLGRLVAMAPYGVARNRAWFRDGIARLASFRTPKGTFLFPRELLPEKKNTYWIGGTHCGLGENRRAPKWIELESTYWAMKLGVTGSNPHP